MALRGGKSCEEYDPPSPQTAMLLTQREWDMLANILAYYLRTTPPTVMAEQRALAERVRDAARA